MRGVPVVIVPSQNDVLRSPTPTRWLKCMPPTDPNNKNPVVEIDIAFNNDSNHGTTFFSVVHKMKNGEIYDRSEQYFDITKMSEFSWEGKRRRRPTDIMVGKLIFEENWLYEETINNNSVRSLCDGNQQRIAGGNLFASNNPNVYSDNTATVGLQTSTHLHTTIDLHLRVAPDPNSQDVLGPPPNDYMPRGSELTITDVCKVWNGSRRGEQDGDNIWCPVVFNGQSGWANAFFLEINGNQRLACVMYPASNGCAIKQ
jgi:hypothetical protein